MANPESRPDLPSIPAAAVAVRRPSRLRGAAAALFAAGTVLAAGCGSDDPSDAEQNQAQAQRGELIAEAGVARLSPAQTDAKGAAAGVLPYSGPALCDVEIRSVVHRTVGTDGEPATVSGALLVPGGPACPGPFPLVAYARGTDRDRKRTLADPEDRETGMLLAMFAARGYAVVATDYLGFAASDYKVHPYLHAETEASTMIDSIRAARKSLASLGVPLSGKLFLTGYSQGGHAAMAAHRAIERDQPAGITVTASAPMAGPYDLKTSLQGQAQLLPELLSEPPATLTDRIKLQLGEQLIEGEINDLLARLPSLQQTLERNSVLDWTPRAPMLLCHGSRDTVVPFATSEQAAATFAARGAPVALVDVEKVPEFAGALPPAGAPPEALSGYHSRLVPPLCFRVVRDRLFETLR